MDIVSTNNYSVLLGRHLNAMVLLKVQIVARYVSWDIV